MCHIGCNWSEPLGALLLSKQVNLDYIKAGMNGGFERLFDRIRPLRPILLHGLGYFEHSGMQSVDMVDFRKANQLIEQCGSPHYGLHLAIENKDMSPGMDDEYIHSHMSKQIQVFKRHLSVPLLLENTPDSPQDRTEFDHFPYAEPEKITRLLIENEVGLLLDLTHAKITALYRNWNVCDYLKAIPLNLIREIHVNGSGFDNAGFPADTHQSMGREDYELLEWVLEHSNPDIVTLEYCGIESEEEDVIYQNLEYQLKELNRLCH